MAYRDGGACAAVPTIIAMLVAGTITIVTVSDAIAESVTGSELPVNTPVAVKRSDHRTTDAGTPRTATTTQSSDPWAAHIAEAAQRFAVPERWIRAVMTIESVGDPTALSAKGAIGLMQVMPATWDELRAKHSLGDDPWQPRDNILAGAAYLRELHDRYGSIAAMLAAYNAGPARYDAHLAIGRSLPAETIDYVEKVTPKIEGAVSIARSAGSSSPRTWSRAPLFVARSTVRTDDDLDAADRPSKQPAIVDLSALVSPSDGLFVRGPEAEGRTR